MTGRPGGDVQGAWNYSVTLNPENGDLTHSPCPNCEGPLTGVMAESWARKIEPGKYERAGTRVVFLPCGCTAHIPKEEEES